MVEDAAGVRRLLQSFLPSNGFDVLLASGGDEAVALYRRRHDKVDLVLMDVQMPGLDGPMTLEALRRINPEVRCCFMSGHTGEYSEADLLERGLALIGKPFTLERLVRTLVRLLAD